MGPHRGAVTGRLRERDLRLGPAFVIFLFFEGHLIQVIQIVKGVNKTVRRALPFPGFTLNWISEGAARRTGQRYRAQGRQGEAVGGGGGQGVEFSPPWGTCSNATR